MWFFSFSLIFLFAHKTSISRSSKSSKGRRIGTKNSQLNGSFVWNFFYEFSCTYSVIFGFLWWFCFNFPCFTAFTHIFQENYRQQLTAKIVESQNKTRADQKKKSWKRNLHKNVRLGVEPIIDRANRRYFWCRSIDSCYVYCMCVFLCSHNRYTI